MHYALEVNNYEQEFELIYDDMKRAPKGSWQAMRLASHEGGSLLASSRESSSGQA